MAKVVPTNSGAASSRYVPVCMEKAVSWMHPTHFHDFVLDFVFKSVSFVIMTSDHPRDAAKQTFFRHWTRKHRSVDAHNALHTHSCVCLVASARVFRRIICARKSVKPAVPILMNIGSTSKQTLHNMFYTNRWLNIGMVVPKCWPLYTWSSAYAARGDLVSLCVQPDHFHPAIQTYRKGSFFEWFQNMMRSKLTRE